MSKVVLVMDMPNTCIDCPCHFADDSEMVRCGKEDKELLADDIQTFKPDWCPLKDMPKKTNAGIEVCIGNKTECIKSYVDGYNACIDEILKGDGAE